MRAILLILLVIVIAIGCLGLSGVAAAGWLRSASLRRSLAQADARVSELESSQEALQSEMAQMRDQLAEAEQEAATAGAILDCGYDVEVNYSGNPSVSRSLSNFVDTAFAEVQEADWEIWWEGASDALHAVTDVDDFSYDFFVYFADPEFEVQDSVFFLDWGCWLDLPDMP